MDSNLIQEKGFIPSTKSFAIAEDELGKMVYYNHAQELLYVLADQVLYRINLDKNQQEVMQKVWKPESMQFLMTDISLLIRQTERKMRQRRSG